VAAGGSFGGEGDHCDGDGDAYFALAAGMTAM
jgi:hypothetical protein